MEKPLKVAVAGLGTVGSAVIRILVERRDDFARQCGRVIDIVGICARDRHRERGFDGTGMRWYDDAVEMAQSDEIDVFVELMGGEDGVARQVVATALQSGHHVVTANKALLAKHGVSLAKMAEEKGVFLNFEAAVAGGIPVIKTMREALGANKITRLYGIMNGTCNYILTRMEEEGLSFSDCLAQAQELGYAEADPTFDIEGNDTAHKLSLLTRLAFGTQTAVDDIYLEGISNISLADIDAARELGYRIKLLGVALKTETGIEQRVHPTMVPISSVIAQVRGVTNAVSIETDLLGELLLSGPGAGGHATASAVIADVTDIAKSRASFQHGPVFAAPATSLKPYKKARMRSHAGGYFIRLSVYDRTGVFASLARHMADNDISLESIVQHPVMDKDNPDIKTIVLVTHETTEAAVRAALKTIMDDGNLVDKPQMIRIERAM